MQSNYRYTILDQIHDHNVAKKAIKIKTSTEETDPWYHRATFDRQSGVSASTTTHHFTEYMFICITHISSLKLPNAILLYSVFYSNIHTMLSHIDNSKTRDDGGDIATTQAQSSSINTGKDALCDQKQIHLIIPDLQYCV